MRKRTVSTILLWLSLAATLWFFRTSGALVLIALISLLTLHEFYQLLRAAGYAPFSRLGLFFGVLITMAPWIHARFGFAEHPLFPLATVIFSIRILGERTGENRVEALAATLFGLALVSTLLQYLVRIVTPLPGDGVTADGRLLLAVWVIAVTKFCDVGALLTGMAVGRHQMSPHISPKKTWEGVAGGIVVAMLVGGFFAWAARAVFPATFSPLAAALIAAPVAAVGVTSDLIESVIKRRANHKDSGHTIPGIGGIFDLSDSLLLATPVAYFLFRLP